MSLSACACRKCTSSQPPELCFFDLGFQRRAQGKFSGAMDDNKVLS
eukprot:CAMPEP_0176056898 /NCGR_PEP_ID=MMETSP0120_2-20121206/28336_1 /TAXON_ID=160619 /ORGANISM="Kryptoperidinium foliaceum, Strain CCMP 1326" /LENGTH=45 /DNA_ID= /DNA_START= /DNA_END= /DNA_ORIENTATION=